MSSNSIIKEIVLPGSYILTELFSASSATGSSDPGSLDFTTSDTGIPIPEVLGTVKLTGNYIYAGGQRCKEQTSSSGGKGGSGAETVTGYKYYLSFGIGICMGPIDTLYSIYDGDELIWSGELNCPDDGVASVSTSVGTIVIFFGTDTQEASSRLGARISDSTLNPPCRGMCWAYFDDAYIGSSASVPTFSFVLRRTPVYSFAENEAISVYDYNPAHAIWHILTTMTGLSSDLLNEASFTAVADTLAGEDRGISMSLSEQESAADYIDNILSHIIGYLLFNADGTFHLTLSRDDYDTDTIPVVTEEMCTELPTLKRASWIDTTNEIKATFTERIYSDEDDPVVLYFCFIDEAKDSYFTTEALGTVYISIATDQWGTDYENAEAYVSALEEYATFVGTMFNVRIANYDPFDAYDQRANMVYPMNASSSDPDASVGWPDFMDSCIDTFRPPSLASLQSAFMEALPSSISLSSDVYVVISCDNSGSMTPSTLGDAYTEWKAWIASEYPSFTIVQHEEARSDERWLSWMVADIDVAQSGPDYETNTAEPYAVNVASKRILGRTESETLSLDLFTKNSNAVWATQEALRSASFPAATLTASLNRDAFRAQPGDVFKFTFAPYGIESMIFRMLTVEEDDLESETISITAEEEYTALSEVTATPKTPEDRSSPSTSYEVAGDWVSTTQTETVSGTTPIMLGVTGVQSVTVSSGGVQYEVDTDYIVDRTTGSVTPVEGGAIEDGDSLTITFTAQEPITRRFLELPYAFSGDEIRFMPLVTRPNGVNTGFQIYFSLDDETYTYLQDESTFAVRGEVYADYPKTFQIDDNEGLYVTFLGSDVGDIESITRTELLGQRNLALIGDELITFQDIEPVFGRTYFLTGVYRGRFTTDMAAHLRGDTFLYIGNSPAETITHSELTTDSTRYFKAIEYNPVNAEEISDVDAIPVTVSGKAYAPYPPCNLLANDEGLHPEYSDDITLDWDSRKRGTGAGLSAPSVPDASPVRDGTFRIRVYSGDELKLTISSILTFTRCITAAELTAAGCSGEDLTLALTAYATVNYIEHESDPVTVTVYYDGEA